ncbi:MAG: hypothetical protein NT117_04640 [Gammaproteobacteria bacterium]|nr:hypothetical protein [Gammaproteobacteria bacterium]
MLGSLAALVAALFGVFALRDGTGPATGKSIAATPGISAEPGSDRGSPQPTNGREPSAARKRDSLPPMTGAELDGLPLEALVARAGKGDAKAACRASFQLSDCALFKEHSPKQLSNRLGELEASPVWGKDAKDANLWASMQLDMLESVERCKAVPPESFAQLAALLRQSALSGNRAGMLKYASGEFLGSSPGLATTRQPGFAAWRADALPMALASLRAGSLEAAFALSNAYRSDEGALDAIVPNDPVEAHVYGLLVHLAQGEGTYTLATLTPAQNDVALNRARALHREIFAGAPARKEAAVLGPSWVNSWDQGAVDPCE